jgi:hypothetical protein
MNAASPSGPSPPACACLCVCTSGAASWAGGQGGGGGGGVWTESAVGCATLRRSGGREVSRYSRGTLYALVLVCTCRTVDPSTSSGGPFHISLQSSDRVSALSLPPSLSLSLSRPRQLDAARQLTHFESPSRVSRRFLYRGTRIEPTYDARTAL